MMTPNKLSAKLDKRLMIAIVIIPILHFGLAKLSQSVSFQNGASAIWPSSGLYLAMVLLLGNRVWLALLISEGIANSLLFYPQDILPLIVVSLGSVVEPLITGFLINRFTQKLSLFVTATNFFKFIFLILPIPAITTCLAVASLCLAGKAPWSIYGSVWQTWYISLITGKVIVTPLVLSWAKPYIRKRLSRYQSVELVLLLISVIVVSRVVFWLGYPLEYVMIPLLIWSAFRFRPQESTLLVTLISGVAVFGTARGLGVFAKLEVNQSLLLLQSFISIIALTTFILSAVISENRRGEAKLRKVNEELEARVEERTSELIAKHLQLTWKYQDKEDEFAISIIEVPLKEDLQVLLELAQEGRLKKMSLFAEEIAKKSKRYQPFIQDVLQLAKQFQTEKIEELLQKHIVGDGV